ncbi:MAG TPA: HAMP domain-containing sensor histidine kinase [Candidatus Limnocylindrales bacterium]|nr:HAMP domain-containing sensor histidine kinase [Candidatus Limnocylindrales bacterium]
MSIRARITWYGIGVVCLVLLVTSSLFGLLLLGSVPQSQDKELRDRAIGAVRSVEAAPGQLTVQTPLTPVEVLAGKDIAVMVLDSDGTVVATTGIVAGRPLAVPDDLLKEATQAGFAQRTLSTAEGGLRVHVRPWQRPDRSGYVVTAQAASRLRADQAGVIVIIILADLIALAAAVIAIWLATGRALRPLRQLAATADEVGQSADLTRRLPPVRRLDHLGRLTASFNSMMDRLQHAQARLSTSLAAQQRFTADASHELRTPLTTIRTNAGFLRAHPDADPADIAAAVADIDEQSQRMTRLVADLLTLARADSSQPLSIGDVDLGPLVADVIAQAARAHPARRFHPRTVSAPVRGEAESLRRLVWILTENAIAYTGESAQIWATVAIDGTTAVVQVADDGPGIPEGMRERIFDRFVRAGAAARPDGTGLGLAIARSVVQAHQGTIRAANNGSGGATFDIRLPLANTKAGLSNS